MLVRDLSFLTASFRPLPKGYSSEKEMLTGFQCSPWLANTWVWDLRSPSLPCVNQSHVSTLVANLIHSWNSLFKDIFCESTDISSCSKDEVDTKDHEMRIVHGREILCF